MSQLKQPKKPVPNWEQVRDEWVAAVTALVAEVEGWCTARGWPTRRIDKKMEDSQIGRYVAPALLIQRDVAQLLLDPIARFVPGADGLVDLYVMPRYDDIASVYRSNGVWMIHYTVVGDDVPGEYRTGDPPICVADVVRPFTAEEFAAVVGRMV